MKLTHNRLEMQPLINQDIVGLWIRFLWRRVVELNVGITPEAHLVYEGWTCVCNCGGLYNGVT